MKNKEKIPLYLLAKRGKLAKVQKMDLETLNWIAKNSKYISYDKKHTEYFLTKNDIFLFKKYFPVKKLFLSSIHSNTIHGQRHIGRVAILALLICNRYLFSKQIKNSVFLAAICHDLQRQNDNEDIFHGQRSANWLRKHRKSFKEIIRETNFQSVLATIKYHNLENNQIPKKIRSKYSKIIGIIKTADALDRFRQPKKKWWVDPKKLKLHKASEFIPFAKYLTIRSEYLALKKIGNKKSLLKAMEDSKILIK